MDQMEQKLQSLLGNPEMMQKIMSMAQTLNQQPTNQQPSSAPTAGSPSGFEFDPAMMQRIMGMLSMSGIDGNQRALLKALSPFLSADRIGKLEKAMQAAKLANIASSALGQFYTGR